MVGDEAKIFPVRQLEGFRVRGTRCGDVRLVIEANSQLHRFKIAFRRRVDDLKRDKIDFAHFYRTTIAGDRHRLAQLLRNPGPKVDAALGPSFRIARLPGLKTAVLGRPLIADFIVASRAAVGLR